MAVLTQVHVASAELAARQRQFALSQQISDVDAQILQHTHNATVATAQGKLEEIRAAMNAMMSELRLYQSYGELESAYGQLLATIGMDPVPNNMASDDLQVIEQSIVAAQKHWDDIGRVTADVSAEAVAVPGSGTVAAAQAAGAAGAVGAPADTKAVAVADTAATAKASANASAAANATAAANAVAPNSTVNGTASVAKPAAQTGAAAKPNAVMQTSAATAVRQVAEAKAQ
jgi:hypothetical protein